MKPGEGGPLRIRPLHLVAVLFLLPVLSKPAIPQTPPEPRIASSAATTLLKGMLIESPSPVEVIAGRLKGSLRKLRNGNWEIEDERGHLVLSALEEQEVYLIFTPPAPRPLSASVLAALISKAEAVGLADAETLELLLRTDQGTFGIASEKLRIRLDNNAWVRTDVVVFRKGRK